MLVDRMSDEVARFLERANELQWRKNADYHPDKIAFLEIMRTACESGVTVEQDLWGRVRKQMSALRRFVIDGHTESESPQSRMLDVAVYMGMMTCWVDHREDILLQAFLFQRDHTFCEHKPPHCIHSRHLRTSAPCDRCMFLFWLEDRAR